MSRPKSIRLMHKKIVLMEKEKNLMAQVPDTELFLSYTYLFSITSIIQIQLINYLIHLRDFFSYSNILLFGGAKEIYIQHKCLSEVLIRIKSLNMYQFPF